MIATLAQATEPAANSTSTGNPLTNFFETMVSLFSRADTLAQPEVLVEKLQALGVIWAIVFLIVGAVCMLNGYKYYKIATMALALVIGAVAGYWLGQQIESPPFIVAGCLGLLLAVTAFPLMKYAVAALGALSGAFIGANLWTGFAHALNKGAQMQLSADTYWVGALLGLIVCGMLAFVLFKLSVVLFTSVSGSTIAVLGALALLLSVPGWHDTVVEGLTASQLVVPLLVFVPALIGLIIQETWPQVSKAEAAEE